MEGAGEEEKFKQSRRLYGLFQTLPIWIPEQHQRWCHGECVFCPRVSFLIKTRRLHFFRCVARLDFRQDHHRAISASLRPPGDWRRLQERPCTTWMMGIDADVQSATFSIHRSLRKAKDRVL